VLRSISAISSRPTSQATTQRPSRRSRRSRAPRYARDAEEGRRRQESPDSAIPFLATGELATGGVVAAGGGVSAAHPVHDEERDRDEPDEQAEFITGLLPTAVVAAVVAASTATAALATTPWSGRCRERGLGQGGGADFVTVAALAATVGFSSPVLTRTPRAGAHGLQGGVQPAPGILGSRPA